MDLRNLRTKEPRNQKTKELRKIEKQGLRNIGIVTQELVNSG